MSVSLLRDAFNQAAPSLNCTAARMTYCDATGTIGGAKRDHQHIEFDLADGTKLTMPPTKLHGPMLLSQVAGFARSHAVAQA